MTCDLLEAAGTNLTFFVKYMESNRGATVVLNTEDSTIRCSCRMFECIGMCTIYISIYTLQAVILIVTNNCLLGLLCKHVIRVFNTNGVYNLPSKYILPRWTKYAKSGFYIEKQGTETGELTT